MGREISFLCDACGRDCTHEHYVLETVRRIYREEILVERLSLEGDSPILCRECFERHLGSLLCALPLFWERDEEGEEI